MEYIIIGMVISALLLKLFGWLGIVLYMIMVPEIVKMIDKINKDE